MSIAPIAAAGAADLSTSMAIAPSPVFGVGGGSFAQLLAQGVDHVSQKVTEANAMVQAFALDDSIPLHQVTYALEQARLSVELMMQVRGRLLEGYQELMRMQL